MIRIATPEDLPRCVEMGADFFAESRLADAEGFDEWSLLRTMAKLIDSPDAVFLVAERGGELVGMSAAISYARYFNESSKIGQELFWWVDPAHRGSSDGIGLLRAMEAWAEAEGCVTFTMIDLPAVESPAARIYERMGYRLIERSYAKAV